MPQIRANRESVDDRFSVLGFTIRTESPLFEVGIATSPDLFKVENRNQRKRNNFYSSRAGGAIRARHGEAVYLVPPQVLSSFVGQPRLYFGLATFSENSQGRPDFIKTPDSGSMYVNTSGLTERGLRRYATSSIPPVYGSNSSANDASIEWGGDAISNTNTSTSTSTSNASPSPVNGSSVPTDNTNPHQNTVNDSDYDDGFGPLPESGNNTSTQPHDNPVEGGSPATHIPTQDGAVSSSSSALGLNSGSGSLAKPMELIHPFYDPADPSSALMSQNNAFSIEREEWFAGVPNTTLFPHSAICQLIMTSEDGTLYQGTGFYIGTNRILTCAHNLSGKTSVKIIPGRNGASSKPYGEVSVASSSWRIAPSYTGSGDWNNDLAVIDNVPLAAPNGQFFGFLNATPSDQLPIVICGYSAGSRKVPALDKIIDGDMQHLHGGYVRGQSNLEVLEYPILTLMGASGSPVYHLTSASGQLQALITGVHVTGEPADDGLNRGCFITPSKIDWIEGRTTSFALSSTVNDSLPQLESYQYPAIGKTLAIPLDPGEGGQSIGIAALQAGDIIVSTARHLVSYAIRLGTFSAISHAMLYVGDGKVIEAVGEGVREIPVDQAIEGALVAVGYRDPRVTNDIGNAIVAYARSRVGSPYNYAGVAFVGYRILNPGGATIIGAIGQLLGLEVGQAGASYCSELVFEAYENSGVPLGHRPSTSTPDDIVDLFGNRLNYVGHLVATDVPLGIPLSVSDSSQSVNIARVFENNAFSIHWDTVPYQPQSSSMSCWAASAAMVVGWRDQMSIPDDQIAAMIPIIDAYKNGLWPRDRQALADVWDLVAEPPASYTIEAWRDMLQSYGPLYIDMTASGTVGGHVRVLVGMESSGQQGVEPTMYMYDPWPGTPGKIKLTFSQFLEMYEGRAGNSGEYLEYQILHSAQIPVGRTPVTSSPFSMEEIEQSNPSMILAPVPDPLIQQEVKNGVSQSMEAGTVAIASVIVGAVMERLVNNQGDINWEVDQLRGFKHPNDVAPSPMPAAADGSVIRLTDWPNVENLIGDKISAGFEINWQYNGKSVGNVMISNVATNDAVGWGLIIKAKIMDDNIVYPRNAPQFAALKVRFEYRFTRTIGSDLIAIEIFIYLLTAGITQRVVGNKPELMDE